MLDEQPPSMEGSSEEAAPGWLDPLQYPFEVPQASYIWQRGQILPLEQFTEARTAGRIAVLAIGSNAAPSRLTSKFDGEAWMPETGPEAVIPVVKVDAMGIDVVYAAHLAPYGSMPATVVDSVGSSVSVFVTWLTPRQFARMNETERLGSNYLLREVKGIEHLGRHLDTVYCYVSTEGAALLGGEMLALDAVPAEGSPLRRGDQGRAWDLLATDMSHADGRALLESTLRDAEERTRVEAHLSTHRVPLASPTLEVYRVISGTDARHHQGRNHPYVLAVAPEDYRRLHLRRLVEVGAPNNGRLLRVIATVVQDASLKANDVKMDQTLRNALGMSRTPTDGVLGFVTIRALHLSLKQWIADKLSWIAGRRYLLLRVGPPDPPDIEKNFCRVQGDDLGALGIADGDHILLLAPCHGRLRRVSLQALCLSESSCEVRKGLVECTWSARYPDAASLLNIENRNDLRNIWVDLDARKALDLRSGDVVMARRSLPSALFNQILDFGVVLLASILALRGLIPNSPVAAVLVGVGLTVGIVIARLRTRLS